MASNSNEIDDLMEEPKSKETKLEKFLKLIDQETLDKINEFLIEYDVPQDSNNKSEKIKLFHDLSIILKFKNNEKHITSKAKQKKIEEVCGELKNEFGFSIATIKERIQKKLANVSKDTILNHIKMKLDFSFDTKRKLMPVKNINDTKVEREGTELDLDLEEKSVVSLKSEQKQIQVHSSEDNSDHDSVEEIVPVVKEKKASLGKKSLLNENDKKDKSLNSSSTYLYNEFQNDSSDDESSKVILVRRKSNTYQISSVIAEEINKELLNLIAKQYNESKNGKNKEASMDENRIDEAEENKEKEQNERDLGHNFKEEELPAFKIETRIRFTEAEVRNLIDISENQQKGMPTSDELKEYCSLEDWKSANSDKENEHLRWFAEEDEYLKNIMSCQNISDVLSKLEVLKKFKKASNIMERIKYLGLTSHPKVTLSLLGNS